MVCTVVLHIHGHAHVKLEPNELQAVDGSTGTVHWLLGTASTTKVSCNKRATLVRANELKSKRASEANTLPSKERCKATCCTCLRHV